VIKVKKILAVLGSNKNEFKSKIEEGEMVWRKIQQAERDEHSSYTKHLSTFGNDREKRAQELMQERFELSQAAAKAGLKFDDLCVIHEDVRFTMPGLSELFSDSIAAVDRVKTDLEGSCASCGKAQDLLLNQNCDHLQCEKCVAEGLRNYLIKGGTARAVKCLAKGCNKSLALEAEDVIGSSVIDTELELKIIKKHLELACRKSKSKAKD
jgi:hypothetical protein